MNISKENLSANACTIKVQLQKADYEKNLSKKIKEYAKHANMPGFRPGKVPTSLVSKIYGIPLLLDVVSEMVNKELNTFVNKNNLNIIGGPVAREDFFTEEFVKGKEDFEYQFDCALYPDFDFELDEDIEVTKYEIEVSKEMIDTYFEELKKRFGTTIEPETAELTDHVFGTFEELDEDGKLLENGIKHSATLVLDTIKLKTIQKKFVGAKLGDLIVFDPMRAIKDAKEVGYMLDIGEDNAKELKSEFNFKIEKITRREKAELNEDLFKKVYPQDNISSLAELEDKVKADAKISFATETDKIFKTEAIDAIVKAHDFDLNKEILQRWLINNNKNNDDAMPVTEEKLEAEYPEFLKNAKRQIIEIYLEKKYSISITREKVKEHLIELFTNTAKGLPKDEVKENAVAMVENFMNAPENERNVHSVYEHLLDQELKSLFLEKLKINNKSISYEDFIKKISAN